MKKHMIKKVAVIMLSVICALSLNTLTLEAKTKTKSKLRHVASSLVEGVGIDFAKTSTGKKALTFYYHHNRGLFSTLYRQSPKLLLRAATLGVAYAAWLHQSDMSGRYLARTTDARVNSIWFKLSDASSLALVALSGVAVMSSLYTTFKSSGEWVKTSWVTLDHQGITDCERNQSLSWAEITSITLSKNDQCLTLVGKEKDLVFERINMPLSIEAFLACLEVFVAGHVEKRISY